ncbi:MAG: hypothetical protein AAFX80_06275 [Cyanobacteria bacterium J06639_18]
MAIFPFASVGLGVPIPVSRYQLSEFYPMGLSWRSHLPLLRSLLLE